MLLLENILFLVLVFVVFFLFELLSGLQIHPFQYALVGAALCLFYLGLLSLSEFVRFGYAYLVSAALTSGLIWFYCVAALKSGRRAMILAALLVATYTFLYVTLQSQDYSLLIGTAGKRMMRRRRVSRTCRGRQPRFVTMGETG